MDSNVIKVYTDEYGNEVLALARRVLYAMADENRHIQFQLPDGHWMVIANQEVAQAWMDQPQQIPGKPDES